MIRSLRLLALLLSFFFASAVANAQSFNGEWLHRNWNALKQVNQGRCIVAEYAEHRYDIAPSAHASKMGGGTGVQTHPGVYAEVTWSTIIGDPAWCVAEGKQLDTVSARTRVWLIRGKEHDDSLIIEGQFDRCLGNGCNDPQMFVGPFQTRFSLKGNALVDVDQDPNSPDMILHRQDWHASHASDATESYRALAQSIARRDATSVRGRMATLNTSTDRVEIVIDQLPRLGPHFGEIVRRICIDCRAVDARGKLLESGVSRMAILVVQADLADGSKWIETAVMQQEPNGWKLFHF